MCEVDGVVFGNLEDLRVDLIRSGDGTTVRVSLWQQTDGQPPTCRAEISLTPALWRQVIAEMQTELAQAEAEGADH